MEQKTKPGNPRRGKKVKDYTVTMHPDMRNELKRVYGTVSAALRFAARSEVCKKYSDLKNTLK